MHDPLTVVFVLRRPWPAVHPSKALPMLDDFDGNAAATARINAARRVGNAWRAGARLVPRPKHANGWRLRSLSSPFWVWRGRELYFPGLVTVWHRDPEYQGDDDSCLNAARHAKKAGVFPYRFVSPFRCWALHVHHWRVQVHPWQSLKRMREQCDCCYRSFRYGEAAVVGANGQFCMDCSASAEPVAWDAIADGSFDRAQRSC